MSGRGTGRGVSRIIGKDDERYFGKEGKILGTALGYRCTLCSYRMFLDLRLDVCTTSMS